MGLLLLIILLLLLFGGLPLGLPLVWVRSLRHRRGDTDRCPDFVPDGPNLRAVSVV
jgi:hypothetical protein